MVKKSVAEQRRVKKIYAEISNSNIYESSSVKKSKRAKKNQIEARRVNFCKIK